MNSSHILRLIACSLLVLFTAGCSQESEVSQSSEGKKEHSLDDGANPYEPGSLVGKSIKNFPDTGLVNQFDRSVSFESLPERPTVISFIYTRCPMNDMCPLIAYKMGSIQERVNSNNEVDANFLLITFDPSYDTPAVLKKYGKQRNLNFDNFELWTGSKETIDQLMSKFKILTKLPPEDKQNQSKKYSITHNMRTYLVNSRRVVRYWYRGSDWKPKDIYKRLKNLN